VDRKTFFSVALKKLAKKTISLLSDNSLVQALEKIAEDRPRQRPPGASKTEEEFQRRCSGCDACMIACPVNVIMIEDLEKRLPLIYPMEAPCLHCTGYPCIAVCPTGALNLTNEQTLRTF
jgi:ferredoxin-type protein NapG